MAVISILSDIQKGAAGRPLLTSLIDHILTAIALDPTSYAIASTSHIIDTSAPVPTATMPPTNPSAPKLQVNGLATVTENASPSTTTPTDRTAMKLNMLRKIRPPPFRYAWTLYHEKNLPAATTTTTDSPSSSSSSSTYEDRLTCMLENIITIKTFWEVVNQFPLANLKMKDSVHFFKRGVRPVWEDPRNVEGGAWTFRVGKSVSAEFWVEVLLLAVGEQFSEVLGKGDDLCGISLSRRFNSDLITIWNRRAPTTEPSPSVTGIKDVILAQLSDNLKPKEGSFYYKKHSEHAGFEEIVAAAKKMRGEGDGKVGDGDAEVEELGKVEDAEAEKVLMREVEEEEVVEKTG
ncbi:MAG: hypothetical protein Q9208_004321 [Pyrenodesmia sp. 3 TL-2023]